MAEARFVPSGKVYRQMFDAQVHLSLSVHEVRMGRTANEDCLNRNDEVRRGIGNETLLSPSPTWSEEIVHEDIRALPDNVDCAKTGSNIIERITQKKQREHNEILGQLDKDLAMLSMKFETLYTQMGEDLLHKLSEHDKKMDALLQQTENVVHLRTLSFQDMHEFWDTISNECAMRRKWIQELDETFNKYEIERSLVISELLKIHTAKLENIRYITTSDLHRLITKDAMMINFALLANRQALARLNLNLIEKELQKKYCCRQRWEKNFQKWKKVKIRYLVRRFKDLMNNPEIQNPKTVQNTLISLYAKQKELNGQRKKILQQIRTIIPPKCSKPIVAEWFLSLSAINDQFNCLHDNTIKELHKNYEDVWDAQKNFFKNEASTYGLTSDEIQDLIQTEVLPLIGICQAQAELHISALENTFQKLANSAVNLSMSFLRFMNGAIHLWEMHTIGLQNKERELHDDLKKVFQSYEEENQVKEAQLDVMEDQLRQKSTSQSLRTALKRTLAFLDTIKAGYVILYEEEVSIVERYPTIILQELQAYSSAVSQFFSVKEVYGKDPQEFPSVYPSLDHGCMDSKNGRVALGNETFTTLRGNVFSCLSFAEEDVSDADFNNVEAKMALFPTSLLLDLQKVVRKEFFNHIEDRHHSVLNSAIEIVKAKKEELRSELDLRFHLHKSRYKRIKTDIYNLRAAELVHHRDSVDKHCRGILQALADIRGDFHKLQLTQNDFIKELDNQIHSMEETYNTVTKSDKLVKICATVKNSVDEYMKVIQESQRDFRQKTEEKFASLREANAFLMKSFKLFSEGGNFTLEEAEIYQVHLEEMGKQIDSADETLMLDMENIEASISKCLEQAKDIVIQLEEKFQFLKDDLMFLEKIQKVMESTRVQIRSEVFKSNKQKQMISTMTIKLKNLTQVLSPEKLCALTAELAKELKNRCHYLNCYMDVSAAVPHSDEPLQGEPEEAGPQQPHKNEDDETLNWNLLLQPTQSNDEFLNDVVVGLIKNLLKETRTYKPQVNAELITTVPSEECSKSKSSKTDSTEIQNGQGADQSGSKQAGKKKSQAGQKELTVDAAQKASKTVPVRPVQKSGKKATSIKTLPKATKTLRLQNVNIITKALIEKFQVFGKPEDLADPTFKDMITNILWKANDTLLQAAKDFYIKKESRPVTRPSLQNSFELCAEEINKRLFDFQSQCQAYNRNSVKEFQQQLETVEEYVSSIPEVVLVKLLDEHLVDLSQSMTLLDQSFKEFLEGSEQKKTEHRDGLTVRFSHPACENELKELMTAEEVRQAEQKSCIQSTRLELQACIRRNADEFVTTLATTTRDLLFLLDQILIVDEVQVHPKVVHRKQAGSSQEQDEDLTELRTSSRTWPGIYYFRDTTISVEDQEQRETAEVTTAKTSLGHQKAIEVRNALHQSYEQIFMEKLEKVEKFSQHNETELLQWQNHWEQNLKILSTLKSE